MADEGVYDLAVRQRRFGDLIERLRTHNSDAEFPARGGGKYAVTQELRYSNMII